VRAPEGAVAGTAKVTLSFADCEEAVVVPAVVEVAIVPPSAEKGEKR
jgi:hypothetical protein